MNIWGKGNRKVINGWAMYDWANSVYALVITSTMFPIFFVEKSPAVANVLGREVQTVSLLSFSVMSMFMIAAILSPILSPIADYSGKKKEFMQFFCYLGSTACAALFFYDGSNVVQGLLAFIIAGVGFSGSIVFYNAYLPEIASVENQDSVSAKGFSLGYLGSMIMQILCLLILFAHEQIGISETKAFQISFLGVAIWWAGFAQITFRRLPKNIYGKKPEGNYLFNGYKELQKTWFTLKNLKGLKVYLFSFLFYSMGLQAVMYNAAQYGSKELHLNSQVMIITIMVIQLFGMAGAYFFSKISKIRNNIFSLTVSISFWLAICVGAYFLPSGDPVGFIIVGVSVGLVMGGVQSMSRSTYSKLLPRTKDHASFFSFYDVMEKLAIVLGNLSFGLATQLMDGKMRVAVLVITIFFVIGLILLLNVKLYLNEDQKMAIQIKT